MMDRRHFVRLSCGAAIGGFLGLEHLSRAAAGEVAGDRRLERIGVQLYTVRTLLEEDFEGTLEAVAEIGYDQVEFHRYFGRSPDEVRQILERLGLTSPAAHFPWEEFRTDPAGIIETAQAVGHRYVILAWMPPEERSSIAQYQSLAAFLDEMGTACKAAGLEFAYHNHDFEFAAIDGRVPFDILLNETDPDLVDFEIDFFWMIKGGRDPLSCFASYPGRFRLCHIKDMAPGQQMVDVGAGDIDFATLLAHSDQAGLKYFFVEHDEPGDPLASIAASYDYLSALRY